MRRSWFRLSSAWSKATAAQAAEVKAATAPVAGSAASSSTPAGPPSSPAAATRWWIKNGGERQARATPIWGNIVFTGGMVVFALGTAAIMYGLRRVTSALNPAGNERWISVRIRDEMRMHPAWAQAMVYVSVFHALAAATTPFGAPLIVPHTDEVEIPKLERPDWRRLTKEFHSWLRVQVAEVESMLLEIHNAEPQVPLADLWVCASVQALAAIGGPLGSMKWGRQGVGEDLSAVTKPMISQINAGDRDVVRLKKVLGAQGFAADEIVALVGHRTVGVHGAANFRPANPIDPNRLHDPRVKAREGAAAASSSDESQTGTAKAPPVAASVAAAVAGPNIALATTTPEVFDNDYFTVLLTGTWSSATSINPSAAPAPAGGKVSTKPTAAAKPTTTPLPIGSFTNPEFPNVVMQPLDMAVMDDAMLRGWGVKFAENEPRFFNSFLKALQKIQMTGWAAAELHETT